MDKSDGLTSCSLKMDSTHSPICSEEEESKAMNMVKIEPHMDSARLLPPLQRAIDANVRCGGQMGAFVRLHLDAALLAEYESPGFNESTAVALDDLPSTQEAKLSQLLSPRVKVEETREVSAAGGYTRVTPPVESTVGWVLTAMREPTEEMRCRYRKDKCSNPRTIKKNGDLHSYCEFHRQRSVINQRKFDKKKREALEKHICRGCAEGGACHDRVQAPHRASVRQATRAMARPAATGMVENKISCEVDSFKNTDTHSRDVDETFMLML